MARLRSPGSTRVTVVGGPVERSGRQVLDDSVARLLQTGSGIDVVVATVARDEPPPQAASRTPSTITQLLCRTIVTSAYPDLDPRTLVPKSLPCWPRRMGRTKRRLDAAAEFGHRLRDERTAWGLSQIHLAEAAGLHFTYVSSVERGERNVSLENIVRLGEAVGVDPGELVTGLKPTPPN